MMRQSSGNPHYSTGSNPWHSCPVSPPPQSWVHPLAPRMSCASATAEPLTSGRPFISLVDSGWSSNPAPLQALPWLDNYHPNPQSRAGAFWAEWQSSSSSSVCDCRGVCFVSHCRDVVSSFVHLTACVIHLTVKRPKKMFNESSPKEERRNLCEKQGLWYTTVLNRISSRENVIDTGSASCPKTRLLYGGNWHADLWKKICFSLSMSWQCQKS